MLTMERRYQLPEPEALARAHALTDYWSKRHGVTADWTADDEVRLSGKVLGVRFDGTVTIRAGTIRATVDAGFLAEKLGARGYVERKLDDYLDPSVTLEALRARVPA